MFPGFLLCNDLSAMFGKKFPNLLVPDEDKAATLIVVDRLLAIRASPLPATADNGNHVALGKEFDLATLDERQFVVR